MQNFIIMNSAGRFYSRAGMPYLWAVSERDANVYGCHDEAVIHARFIEANRTEFGLPNRDQVERNLSPLFIDPTDLPVSP